MDGLSAVLKDSVFQVAMEIYDTQPKVKRKFPYSCNKVRRTRRKLLAKRIEAGSSSR